MKQDNKKGEIKKWDEYRVEKNIPKYVGGSGALGLIGGVLGRTVKTLGNAAKQYFSGSSSIGKKVYKPNTVSGSNVKYTIERPGPASQGLSTPLTPKFTPKNPRGRETITWKGGRKMTKPGTPGHSRNLGGKETYTAKDPLWPKEIDKVLYPKNWK